MKIIQSQPEFIGYKLNNITQEENWPAPSPTFYHYATKVRFTNLTILLII